MKKGFTIIALATILASCDTEYYYAQVLQTQCSNRSEQLATADPEVMYEDANCIIYYETWAENGNGGFGIYNKSNQLLHVNLAKSLFVCNGVSYPYYKASTESATSDVSSLVATSFGSSDFNPLTMYILDDVNQKYTGTSTFIDGLYNKSCSPSATEIPDLAVAPKTSIWISAYPITDMLIVDCDLPRYPSEKVSMSFSDQDSPIHFGNFITYSMEGSDQEIMVENKFYVSSITNYAWPSLLIYQQRKEKPCQNVTNNPSKRYTSTYPTKVYDRYFSFDITNCFYLLYHVNTSEQLYKMNKTYYYNTSYQGFSPVSD